MMFLVSAANAVSLDPMKIGVGARSLAMGRTAAGLAGDINSMFVNPANAADFKGWGGTSMYTSLLEGDITYTLIGGGYEAAWGTLGLSYLGGGTAGIQVSSRDADGRIVATGTSFDYSNSVITLIYGKEIMESLSAGAALKLFNKGFSSSYGSGSGYDLDLGLLWKPRSDLTVGISQQNTLPADVAAVSWDSSEKEGIPFNTKVGCAYTPRRDLLLAGDLDYAADSPMLFHGGVEWNFRENLDLRTGLDQVATDSSNVATNFGFGIGIGYEGFVFDLAYYLDSVLAANSTYYLTISYLMPQKAAALPPAKAEEVLTLVPGAPTCKTFSDVCTGYWAEDAINTLAEGSIIGGYPDGTFRPEGKLTRAELCSLLVKAKKVKVSRPRKALFSDLPPAHWAAPYIQAAVDLKLVGGYPDGTFQPSKPLNRVEGVLILSRFANLKPIRGESPYYDLPESHWAAPNIAAAKEADLLDYIKSNYFEPPKGFTRAEAAYILHAILK
jgi:hypothetical protein